MYILRVESNYGIWVSEDHGNLLLIINIELWKYRYRSVFDTLVVYTVNLWVLRNNNILLHKLTRKHLTWEKIAR